MNLRIISRKIKRAKKEYTCAACDAWMASATNEIGLSSADTEILDLAEADYWRILPGQSYIWMLCVSDSGLSVFRARPAMDDLCRRHYVYDDLPQLYF